MFSIDRYDLLVKINLNLHIITQCKLKYFKYYTIKQIYTYKLVKLKNE